MSEAVNHDSENAWIESFQKLKGDKQAGDKLWNEFIKMYGPGPENADSIYAVYVENDVCGSKKDFASNLFDKRNSCFKNKDILRSDKEYPLSYQKYKVAKSSQLISGDPKNMIKNISCSKIPEYTKDIISDINTHCSSIFEEQKGRNVLPSGYTGIVSKPRDSATRAIGIFEPQ